MNTSRKKYRRSLQVNGLIRLVLLGVIAAVAGGAFVMVKNRQHALANAKGQIENEIFALNKEIETLDLRIAAMIDRDAISSRISDFDGQLVKIERAVKVKCGGANEEQYASYDRGDSENFQ